MADIETKTTVRLTKEDETNVARIVSTGIATNTAEAIRVALALVGRYLTPGSVLEIVEHTTPSLSIPGVEAPRTVRARLTAPSKSRRSKGKGR
jgi:hypothetical protein